MNPYGYSYWKCNNIVNALLILYSSGKKFHKISYDDISQLKLSCDMERNMEDSDRYSKPMEWIGIYIAIASFFCILAMTANLLHGFRNKKFWFPCKYFSLNAASITVITIAMKLPVDLNSEMPNYMDQATKLGSLAFMCSMMANLMPSLASMDNKTLLANVIGLSIFVITMIVNICIQLSTGVIDHISLDYWRYLFPAFDCVLVALIYTAMILLLLIIMISASLTIPTSKDILEFKYQARNKTSITDQILQNTQMSVVEKLRQHVRRYWVMAETGSPQFVMASNPLSTASGLICVIVLVVNLLVVFKIPFGYHDDDPPYGSPYGSPYKRSTLAIVITQSIGVVVGTIAPLFRCFSVLSFKLVTNWNRNIFMLEMYWTQKLYEWKQSPIPFLSSSRRSRTLLYNSKSIILSLCIILQRLIVISCKLISVIPKVVIYYMYCWMSMKGRLFTPTITTRTDDINEELSIYVLQIHNEIELAEKTLKRISNSINSFILKAEKEQNKDLSDLLKKSTGLEGVENFDTDHVQSLLSVELVNSWSLPIVTLTCIAVALPNIHKDTRESLLISVGEGLSYTHIVEESLNCASEYANLRKASMALWLEVENKYKWLDNTLAKSAFKGKTATEILKWFADRAEKIVIEIKSSINGEMVENIPKELIAANSMYRISQTILLRYQSNTAPINEEQLFVLLNGMISDILFACFTNLPRVIAMKCHENVIEKRESSVKVAAKLLGKTTKIIERLDTRVLPSMDHDKMAYIDEWRLYLKQSIP